MAAAAFSCCHGAGGMVVIVVVVMAMLGGVVAGGEPPFSCGGAAAGGGQGYAFCDATLPAEQRAADLVARLTAAEKVAQLGDQAAGVPRLGVPAYKWWSEALHGLATSGRGLHFDAPGSAARAATSFPQVLLTAAAFDDDLWFRIGQLVAVSGGFVIRDKKGQSGEGLR
uniref:Uncharacterized protein n=1 Tax=Oryza nivara TaxID=4536 RepID=A0A0E0J115_ORYNI